jgi:hypothetical protein
MPNLSCTQAYAQVEEWPVELVRLSHAALLIRLCRCFVTLRILLAPVSGWTWYTKLALSVAPHYLQEPLRDFTANLCTAFEPLVAPAPPSQGPAAPAAPISVATSVPPSVSVSSSSAGQSAGIPMEEEEEEEIEAGGVVATPVAPPPAAPVAAPEAVPVVRQRYRSEGTQPYLCFLHF